MGVLAVVFATALAAISAGGAPPASPSPAPARPRPVATDDRRLHRAIVVCQGAPFYSWPAPDVAPAIASYPPGRPGDAFDVIGTSHIAYGGENLYETTIDVVAPWGSGKHYWVAAACVNAAP